jgi:hypothetical protein
MSVLAFNCRGMQATFCYHHLCFLPCSGRVSIAKNIDVALGDKSLECSTLLQSRELVSCLLEDLHFVGRVGASNA